MNHKMTKMTLHLLSICYESKQSPQNPQPSLYNTSSLLIFSIAYFPSTSAPFQSQLIISFSSSELAFSQQTLEEDSDSSNCGVVRSLYRALSSRDVATVHRIVAPDLEWWFHGPPTHQFLMRLLTGTATAVDAFQFLPDSITSLGPIVLAEGCDQARSIYWVHAWTVTDGIITQVREYFNTSLTVTRLGGESTSAAASSFSEIASSGSHHHCPSVWESSLSGSAGKSVPGLVLAI